MEITKICERMQLDKVDQKWLESVEDFVDFNDPSDEYLMIIEGQDMSNVLHEMRKAIRRWIDSSDLDATSEEKEVSWRTLKAHKIDSNALLGVLGYIIRTGQRSGVGEDSRQLCLRATSLYFTLLSIPGSSAYCIFHANLFQLAVETFKLTEHLMMVIIDENPY